MQDMHKNMEQEPKETSKTEITQKMKPSTTLTPPPITPGPWKQVNLNTCKVGLELGLGTSEGLANAIMALAAPQMAAALEGCFSYLGSLGNPIRKDPSFKPYQAVKKALKAAGYTLKD